MTHECRVARINEIEGRASQTRTRKEVILRCRYFYQLHGFFGFHKLRHSLASFLVRTKTDPKTVQALLRHSDVKTTLQLYSHSVSEDRMKAQGAMLEPILGRGTNENGLRAD